jgi:hypothetical protein
MGEIEIETHNILVREATQMKHVLYCTVQNSTTHCVRAVQ